MTKEKFVEKQPQTEEEKRLWEKVVEYENDYFEDFTLKPTSILHNLLVYEIQDETGNFVETSEDPPYMELSWNYDFKIEDLDDCTGLCNKESRIITIDPKYTDDPAVLLHEMIHAYISLFQGDQTVVFLECLLLRLYNELKTKIPDLEKRIIEHTHTIRQEDFINHGSHGLLFYLKSLDLDMRLGLPLGTVCGYGRDY